MEETQSDLEASMKKLSVVALLLGLELLVLGLSDLIIHGGSLSVPGVVARSPSLTKLGMSSFPALLARSAGIVLLARPPVERALLTLLLHILNRQVLNVVVALLVFIELLASLRTGA